MTPSLPIFTSRITDESDELLSGDGTEVFPYWSVTKTVLAVCALKLVEAGRLDLDAPTPGELYTLRQLLNHTAGIPDYFTLDAYRAAVAADEPPWPRDALYEATMSQGLLFPPGEGWSYSNLGYMLVREKVEQAAGQPFADYLQQEINAPLGLHSITLAASRTEFARVFWPAARNYHPGWVYHGCLTGTAGDAARFLHALMTGKLLTPASLSQMLDRQPLGGPIEGRPWTDCGYSLGLMNGSCGAAGRAIGHSGGGPFCVNAVYHFPDAPCPVTVASFAAGPSEAVPEAAAAHAALEICSQPHAAWTGSTPGS